MIFVTLTIFLAGLCVGSFLGVLIYREAVEEGPKQKAKSLKHNACQYLPSWFYGRSYCDHCRKPIRWHDNIPLLSFILLRGRCRYCRKKISLQYPLLELLTGIQFVWVFLIVRGNINFFSRFEGFYSFLMLGYGLLLAAILLMVLVADLQYQIIPDSGIMIGILLTLGQIYVTYRYTGYVDWSVWPAAFGAALFFTAIILITKGKGMGWGDVKLGFLMGLMLGFPRILAALFIAYLTGGIAGVILILSKRKTLKQSVAFGPFLVIATAVAYLWGSKIIGWYLGKIG